MERNSALVGHCESSMVRKISVILPAYNEAGAIGEVLAGVRRVAEQRAKTEVFEIIVVDDGSTDGTPEVAEEAGARVVRHPYNIGNGASVKAGMRAAGGDVFVMMDADGQHRPEEIPMLLDALEDHAMVVGARTSEGQANPWRRLANGVYNLFASYVTSRSIPDLTSGFRVVRAGVALSILDEDTAGTLHNRLAELGAPLVVETLDLVRAGDVPRLSQHDTDATFAPKLTKQDGRIDWRLPAEDIYNRIRGFNPWPCCHCRFPKRIGGGLLRVLAGRAETPAQDMRAGDPGDIIDVAGDGPLVATGEGGVRLLSVQPEGRRVMSGHDYMLGHDLRAGDVLM